MTHVYEPLYPVVEFKRRYYRINGRVHYDILQKHMSPLCPDEEWVPVCRRVREIYPARLAYPLNGPGSMHTIYMFNQWLRETFGETGPPDGTEVPVGSRML